MRKYILDFVFNERTGATNIVVDFHDQSMTPLEINTGIRDGSLRDELLEVVKDFFGDKIADEVKSGKLDMICLDDEPQVSQVDNSGSSEVEKINEENTQ
ncbi:hypothetical protein [Candidatus Uabimicrobium sp. HlEnr_7]|uniref:hypothetical protein n=1 Tax=Candidatus Uabimicrobium helgolandensis TaxID=3095367 RepID=UPI0035592FBD